MENNQVTPGVSPVNFTLNLEISKDEVNRSGRLRAGDLCPSCQTGRLDYDGLLNLSCPKCGYALGGCFT